MNRLALAAILSLFGTAQAADYTLTFSGSGVHDQDYWECLHIGANPDCPTALPVSWAGGLRLSETAGSITAVSMVSNLEGFDYPALNPYFEGFLTTTIEGDHVTSLDGTVLGPGDERQLRWSFAGLSIDYTQSADHHYGPTTAAATITSSAIIGAPGGPGPVPAIPEPGTWAMLAGGLGILAWRGRKNGRAT